VVNVRYDVHEGELVVFFTADELNVALAYENAIHRPRGISSGELLYACVVDSINEQSGVPAIGWRRGSDTDRPDRKYPESVETGDGLFVVRTRDGQDVAVSS
jgi:hypothetical protein